MNAPDDPVLRLALAQQDSVVGDLEGNAECIVGTMGVAARADADLVVFPELAVTGYPPEDLVLKGRFVMDNLAALDVVAAATAGHPGLVAVVGFVDRDGVGLRNAAAVCAGGQVVGRYHKRHLPNYAVFDEERYFEPRSGPAPLFSVAGTPVGISICEDAWFPGGPVADAAAAGAQLVVNLNASPYHRGRVAQRQAMLAERAREAGCPVAYVNLVGGQDELVFDGASMVVGADGEVLARAPQYREALLVVDVVVTPAAASPDAGLVTVTPPRTGPHLPPPLPADADADANADADADPGTDRVLAPPVTPLLAPAQETYEALVLGTRDYVTKNGFAEVVIGLSGGVDSSLVAAVAVDALGADRVHGVLMPSRFSSDHSLADAVALAEGLGIEHRTIPIEAAHEAFLALLVPSWGPDVPGLAGENLQPRIRGTLLMALSNAYGWLVLTTGNKSEMAVGYATLYGDMAGGFAVLKDVPKLLVYELCRDRNDRAGRPLIPESVLTKAPSAELRPDQRDTDSLPPYEVLDPILADYVEGDRTASELIAAGRDEDLVRRVVALVDRNEYKRRQSPPGPRITTKAFGKDRRLPITNRYRG